MVKTDNMASEEGLAFFCLLTSNKKKKKLSTKSNSFITNGNGKSSRGSFLS